MAWQPTRGTDPERMDDHDSDPVSLCRTLDQMRLINRLFSRNRFIAETIIIPHMLRQQGRRFTVCDLGAGGGEFALWLSERLSALSITARIICIDIDTRAVAYARRRCRGVDGIEIVQASALCLPLAGNPDYIFANHFLHHLHDDDVVELMRVIHCRARLGYVVNDLRRSLLSYLLFAGFAACFLHHSFARSDGLLSIRKGFTRKELRRLVARAGPSPSPRIRLLFPGRIVIEHFI